jgi:hypothetical protein
LEQVDHAPNDETTQCTAHVCASQLRVSSACGQASPPQVGASLLRLRDCEPPVPHDTVQVLQEPQALILQSVGHDAALQSRVSAECGQAPPPQDGGTMARLRPCEPLPHDLVQGDHALSEKAEYAQLTGQHAALQSRVSSRYGHT